MMGQFVFRNLFHRPMRTLIGVVAIVGALTFFPALSLGPILEHLLMQAGKTF